MIQTKDGLLSNFTEKRFDALKIPAWSQLKTMTNLKAVSQQSLAEPFAKLFTVVITHYWLDGTALHKTLLDYLRQSDLPRNSATALAFAQLYGCFHANLGA